MPEEEAVEAPPEEEPAGEEVDEATFFIDQGLYDEAREILETVLIAYPEHQRAAQLLAQVDAAQKGGGAPVPSDELGAPPQSTGERDAFNLAAELANELGELEEQSPEPPAGDDYQVSVDEVFAEFKKGLEKVVKPEDVETHYDLGVAYKEMGLMEDAVSEFTIARKGCVGKRKEVDCLSMIGMLQVMRGDFPPAIDAFLQALTSEHAKEDVEKSLRFDLGGAYEAAGQQGRALSQYLRVQRLDPSYREVADHVERLSAVTSPEDDAPAPPARPGGAGGGGKPGVRKVGFV
jgi:tetratricopeptide (TPR) repeat protein